MGEKVYKRLGIENLELSSDEAIEAAIKKSARITNAVKFSAIAASAAALIYTGYKLLTGQGKESN